MDDDEDRSECLYQISQCSNLYVDIGSQLRQSLLDSDKQEKRSIHSKRIKRPSSAWSALINCRFSISQHTMIHLLSLAMTRFYYLGLYLIIYPLSRLRICYDSMVIMHHI